MFLFSKDVTVSKIREEELRNARMSLQMERSKSRQKLQYLEQQKQRAFEKSLEEKNRDLRRSYLHEIATCGFQMQLERALLEAVEGQLRAVSVVEATKEFQSRRVKSGLLEKLKDLRFYDLDKRMGEIAEEAFKGDAMAAEIIRRWQGIGLSAGSEDIQELERLIEQAQANTGEGANIQQVAEKLNQQHDEMMEKARMLSNP